MEWVEWDESYMEGIVELWNKELKPDFPMRKALFEQNSFNDINVCREASMIVLDDIGRVIGFIVAKKWQDTLEVSMPKKSGWIQVLVVATQYKNKGVGTRLLKHAESTLRREGIEQIMLGRDPRHYFPGIPEEYENTKRWFESKGYKAYGKDHDLIRTYNSGVPINEPDFPDIEFSVLDLSEMTPFLAFLNECFPGRWEYEAMKYFEKGGTGREFVVIRKQGNIIGFCRINDSESPIIAQNVYWAPLFGDELGGIGPLGVDAKERGQGYGLAIVEAGITELRQRGNNRIVIDWTGLVDFYKKLGYNIWKSYDSYKKVL